MSCWSLESALAPRAWLSLCSPAAITKPLQRGMQDGQTCSNPMVKEVSEGGYKDLALLTLQPAFPNLLFGPKWGELVPIAKLPLPLAGMNGKREVCALGKQQELFV